MSDCQWLEVNWWKS